MAFFSSCSGLELGRIVTRRRLQGKLVADKVDKRKQVASVGRPA
jgi:hypothetical protein